MKIKIKNLGPLKKANFELGDLTIICGENNSGKTSATYLLFDVLSNLRQISGSSGLYPQQGQIDELVNNKHVSIELSEYIENAITVATKTASTETVTISFDNNDFDIDKNYQVGWPVEGGIVWCKKNQGAKNLLVTFENISKPEENSDSSENDPTRKKNSVSINTTNAKSILSKVLNYYFFPKRCFIVSSERTGIAVFQSEINVANGRIVADLKDSSPNLINKFLTKYQGHSKPILDNIEFINSLPRVTKMKSGGLAYDKNFKSLLDEFNNIVGGEYHLKDGIVSFIPLGTEVKLDVENWSSSVRSLMLLNYYFLYWAHKDDVLLIDEPELNLHPKNQRKIARLLARAVNAGIKVLITTHSDYIVRELNTLIMLNKEAPHIKAIKKEEGYQDNEVLNAEKVKAYVTKKDDEGTYTLIPADINEYGIEMLTFDETIEEQNRIQEAIVWRD